QRQLFTSRRSNFATYSLPLHILPFYHPHPPFSTFFFFTDTSTTEIYTLSYTTLFRSQVDHRQAHAVLQRRLAARDAPATVPRQRDRKSTRLNSSHVAISYAVFCLKKKKKKH